MIFTYSFFEKGGIVINIFSELFGKSKEEPKKRVMAFVDFEHWYISLDKLYHKRPDIKGFRDELADRYEIVDIAFFGDFSNPSLRAEITNIRQVSNTIIDTQNATDKIVKDFTDFIILDHIYQSALNKKEADAYVIFTGDGHFSSVASFLVTKCRKEVGIYAVRQAASAQLIGCASYSRILPDEEAEPIKKEPSAVILRNLKQLYDKQTKKKPVYPTFWATVEAVVRHYHIPREEVASTMRALIRSGYLYQTKETVGKQKDPVKVIRVNWDKVKADHMM